MTWRILLSAMMMLGAFMVQGGEVEAQEITLKEVPKVVKRAARRAVRGIKFTEAEKEVKDGVVLYELEGTADGKEYELLITAKGKVLKKELEDDDEGEGEDDDHDGPDDDEDDDDHGDHEDHEDHEGHEHGTAHEGHG